MALTYEVKTHSHEVLVLFDDGQEVVVNPGDGPGFWKRTISLLKEKLGREVDPAEFDDIVEMLYYDYSPHELRSDPAKMERLGFFECPQCHCVFKKLEFTHFDPCDNCRWTKRLQMTQRLHQCPYCKRPSPGPTAHDCPAWDQHQSDSKFHEWVDKQHKLSGPDEDFFIKSVKDL